MDAVMMNIQLMDFMKEIGLEGSVLELSELIGHFYLDKIALDDNTEENKHESTQNSFENIFLVDEFIDEIRSEEHTSELQSRFDLVCRLLLEKKKICRE